MIIYIVLSIVIGFLIGWVWRDHKWTKCARQKEFMVIDNKLYTVKEHKNEYIGRTNEK